MITSNTSSARSTMGRIALLALGCAFAINLAVVQVPAVKAAETAALQPAADKAPALPLTATFEKGTAADKGPYVLKLTNTSKDTVKVSAKILLSVAFHMGSKNWDLPEHAIEAGQVWTIPDLSAGDKITVTAPGFAPLELVVP
jgi:hypothetical protein